MMGHQSRQMAMLFVDPETYLKTVTEYKPLD